MNKKNTNKVYYLFEIKSKKGVIGEGMTWFVATILIFFISILLIVFSTMISIGGVFSSEDYSESFSTPTNFLSSHQILLALLDLPIDDGKNFEQIFFEWVENPSDETKKILLETTRNFVEPLIESEECYFFSLGYDLIERPNYPFFSKGILSVEYNRVGALRYSLTGNYVSQHLTYGDENFLMGFYKGECRVNLDIQMRGEDE